MSAAALGPACLCVIVAYAGLNVLYCLWLKHVVIADVICIALWIALCMFCLALFLGFAKRRSELARFTDDSAVLRPVLAKYDLPYLDMMLAISAAMAVLSYALFTVASHRNATLIITIVPVVYCVSRYLLQVMLHGEGAAPDRVLLTDRRLWAGIVCWLFAYLIIVYGNVRLFAETAVWYAG